MKNSLHYGLSMSLQEKTSRFECNLEFCREMTICKWIETVLSDLMKIQHSIDPTTITTLGLGPNYRVTNLRSAFSTLDLSILTKAYRKSKQRLIILNWGGTLIDPIENFEAYGLATGIENSLKEMSPQLKDVLATLAHDLQNHIFVISRQDTKTMASYFGDIKGLGLAAEHGCYYLHPKAHLLHPDKWQAMISIDDRTWMDAVKRIMKLYTHRTHGSYIEEKESALIWQYDDADLEFGLLQSQELEEHLSDILSIHPLEITRGPGYLEIRPSGLSKGYFLQHMLSKLNSCGQIDFLLTMGNDITDEEMFDITNLTQATMGAPHCFSIAVGKQISTAKYCVNTPEEAREVLYTLLRASKLRRDYSSVLDFPTHYSFSKVGPEIVPRKSSGKRRSYSEVDVALLSSEATPKTSPNLDMKQDLHLISTAHDMPLAFTDKCFVIL